MRAWCLLFFIRDEKPASNLRYNYAKNDTCHLPGVGCRHCGTISEGGLGLLVTADELTVAGERFLTMGSESFGVELQIVEFAAQTEIARLKKLLESSILFFSRLM